LSDVHFLVVPSEQPRDRRSSRRFEIVGELWTAVEWPASWSLRNIGRGGALVESCHPLPLESLHAVSLSPAPGVAIRARVRHLTRAAGRDESRPYLIGFEFLDRADSPADQMDALKIAVVAGPPES
jgi:hypothetical protein